MLSCLEKAKEEPEPNTTHPQAMVATGVGLAALPKKLVEKIKANEYIDFTELPLAKGKSRPVPQSLEGQVLVVQAADLLQARKIIPDLATWLQCFALYVATLAPLQPGRVPEMMAYQTIIAKASQKYRWPSWIVYDQNFRQEAANNPAQSWTKMEPSIYAQCFTGQAISPKNWCVHCHCLDHATNVQMRTAVFYYNFLPFHLFSFPPSLPLSLLPSLPPSLRASLPPSSLLTYLLSLLIAMNL